MSKVEEYTYQFIDNPLFKEFNFDDFASMDKRGDDWKSKVRKREEEKGKVMKRKKINHKSLENKKPYLSFS